MEKEVVKISIIVPIYKIKEDYLRKCINSLLKQTFNDIEILLVDDGSPDQSGIICDGYSKEDCRIKVFHQKNKGVSEARNVGIANAIGKYLMFVDPDDWIELDCCERLFNEMENRNLELILFQRCEESEYSGKIEYFKGVDSCNINKTELRTLQRNIIGQMPNKYNIMAGASCGKIIKRELIYRCNLLFPRKLRKEQDDIFSLYLYENINESYYLDYIGYHYRIHNDSINHRYNPDMLQIRKDIFNEIEKFITMYHVEDKNYERSLGTHCIKTFSVLEVTYFFHEESHLKKKEIISICKEYLNDNRIKKYIKMCRWKDFETFNRKLRYLTERPNVICLNLYYCIMKFYRKK